jgi:RNA polymerase sigma factor (TIGR02999 family)
MANGFGCLPADGGVPSDRAALDLLYTASYDELRRLAAQVRRSAAFTISPTTVVNEAWAKLAGSPWIAQLSREHFRRLAARAMRQVLVEAARRRTASKRGGKDLALVTFDESLRAAPSRPAEVLALNVALDELAALEPRQAQMVEYRFFGGYDAAETAVLLGVSEATVHRDWRAARAFLAGAMRRTD